MTADTGKANYSFHLQRAEEKEEKTQVPESLKRAANDLRVSWVQGYPIAPPWGPNRKHMSLLGQSVIITLKQLAAPKPQKPGPAPSVL